MGDSGFFQELLQGYKQGPLGAFNQTGPVPPEQLPGAAYPTTPLSQINSNTGQLLGNLAPYDKDPSFSQEPSYQETALSIPKVIPVLKLPNAAGTDLITVSRSVNSGDVAWTMRCPQGTKFMPSNGRAQFGDFPRDPIINVSIANYLLRGLQRWAHKDSSMLQKGDAGYWWVILAEAMELDLETEQRPGANKAENFAELITATLKWDEEQYVRRLMNIFRPLGVVHGSNQQGGQHQGGSTVTWPVDYVTTIVVDGKVQHLSNYWRHQEVWAGDDLRFVLRWVPKTCHKNLARYTLTSVPKSMHSETFEETTADDAEFKAGGFYQFVPETSRAVQQPKEGLECGDFHHQNFWHVARSRVSFGAMPHANKWKSASDETQAMNGVVLEVTWNPYENTCGTAYPGMSAIQTRFSDDDMDNLNTTQITADGFDPEIPFKFGLPLLPAYIRGEKNHSSGQMMQAFELAYALDRSPADVSEAIMLKLYQQGFAPEGWRAVTKEELREKLTENAEGGEEDAENAARDRKNTVLLWPFMLFHRCWEKKLPELVSFEGGFARREEAGLPGGGGVAQALPVRQGNGRLGAEMGPRQRMAATQALLAAVQTPAAQIAAAEAPAAQIAAARTPAPTEAPKPKTARGKRAAQEPARKSSFDAGLDSLEELLAKEVADPQ